MISVHEIIEKFLAVFLSVMSTMGMFLTAVLFPIMMDARLEK